MACSTTAVGSAWAGSWRLCGGTQHRTRLFKLTAWVAEVELMGKPDRAALGRAGAGRAGKDGGGGGFAAPEVLGDVVSTALWPDWGGLLRHRAGCRIRCPGPASQGPGECTVPTCAAWWSGVCRRMVACQNPCVGDKRGDAVLFAPCEGSGRTASACIEPWEEVWPCVRCFVAGGFREEMLTACADGRAQEEAGSLASSQTGISQRASMTSMPSYEPEIAARPFSPPPGAAGVAGSVIIVSQCDSPPPPFIPNYRQWMCSSETRRIGFLGHLSQFLWLLGGMSWAA